MNITVFGEILWDIFGEEKKIGGAPFNFGAHVKKLGGEVNLVSAVGKDELGRLAVDEAKSLGLSVESIAEVDYPTGHCLVTLNNGTPSYNLVRDVAYDNIPKPNDGVYTASTLYFGTLAQRSGASLATLNSLLNGKYDEVFFDINIRQSYYSKEMIDNSLKHTTIFKVSREEIGVLNIDDTLEKICVKLSEQYKNLKLIIVTLDKDGAFVYNCKDGEIKYSPKPKSKVVSTVGAGDSFSACFIYNYLLKNSLEVCLERATALSDYVVTQLGAVPEYTAELIKKIK